MLRTQEGKSLAAGDLIQVVVRAETGSYLGAAFIPLRSLAMLDSYVYAYREPWPNCGAFEDFLGGSWQDEHVAGAGRMKSSDRQLASRSIIFWVYFRLFCCCL